MTEPRLDPWNRPVPAPRDHTWDTRPTGEVQWCDLCGVCAPIEPDAHDVTGLYVCTPCIEATLEGASQ